MKFTEIVLRHWLQVLDDTVSINHNEIAYVTVNSGQAYKIENIEA